MTEKTDVKKLGRLLLSNGFNMVVLSIFTGLFAGVVVTFYNICTSFAEEASVNLYGLVRENPAFVPLLFVGLAAGAIVIGTVVKFVPMIRGSGIPQIEGAARGIIKFKWYVTMCSMFAASLACVFLGLSAGAEGPSLEIGGCAGEAVGATLRRSQMTRRLQIAGGASAGLAVAFNAPITGMVFALEEAFRSFSSQVFICSAISVITSLFTRNLIRGALGLSVGFTFSDFVFAQMDFAGVGFAAIAAVITALCGVGFYYAMLGTKKLFKKIKFLKGVGKYLIPFLAAGAFGLITAYAMGGGHEFIQSLATKGTGVYDIERIFGIGLVATLVIVVAFKFIAGVMSMGCGIPCGVFIPMLAIGAGVGAILSVAFTAMGMNPAYADYLVIICMSVFFTTIVKAPITGIVMVFELTGQFQNFLPALLGIAIGYLISELFRTEAIYEKCLEMFIDEEKLYEGTVKHRVEVTIQKDSSADGALVRKIIWPTNGLVVEVIDADGKSFVPDGETMLHAGQRIIFECETSDREALCEYLYDVVGKPSE